MADLDSQEASSHAKHWYNKPPDITIFPCPYAAFALPHAKEWWEELRSTAVDIAQAPYNDLSRLQEQCLVFATIHTDQGFEPVEEYGAAWPSRDQFLWPRSRQTQGYPSSRRIGIVYLSPPVQDQLTPGVLNIGVILDEVEQRKGFGGVAVTEALKWAFDDLKLHRIQANVVDSPNRDHALKMFTKAGFTFEGIRRGAVMDPNDGVWKDATCLAMLDTDWVLRSSHKNIAMTSWDEMFSRHTAERELLLSWQRERRQRTNSLQTLRPSLDQQYTSKVVDETGYSSGWAGSSSGSVRSPSVSSNSESEYEGWSLCASSPPPDSDSESHDSAPESSVSDFLSSDESDSDADVGSSWDIYIERMRRDEPSSSAICFDTRNTVAATVTAPVVQAVDTTAPVVKGSGSETELETAQDALIQERLSQRSPSLESATDSD